MDTLDFIVITSWLTIGVIIPYVDVFFAMRDASKRSKYTLQIIRKIHNDTDYVVLYEETLSAHNVNDAAVIVRQKFLKTHEGVDLTNVYIESLHNSRELPNGENSNESPRNRE